MEWRNGVSFPVATSLYPTTILALQTEHISFQVPFFSVETRQTKDETNYSPTTPSFAFMHARTYEQDQFYFSVYIHVLRWVRNQFGLFFLMFMVPCILIILYR